jgi:hypothetical protein
MEGWAASTLAESCIGPSARKERGPQDDKAGLGASSRHREKRRFRHFGKILSSPCGGGFWGMLLIRFEK